MNLVWERAPYEAETLLTLLALADWANDQGDCWCWATTLAIKSRQSVRNTFRILRVLQDDGVLVQLAKGNKITANRYGINVEQLSELPSLQAIPGQFGMTNCQPMIKCAKAPGKVVEKLLHDNLACHPGSDSMTPRVGFHDTAGIANKEVNVKNVKNTKQKQKTTTAAVDISNSKPRKPGTARGIERKGRKLTYVPAQESA